MSHPASIRLSENQLRWSRLGESAVLLQFAAISSDQLPQLLRQAAAALRKVMDDPKCEVVLGMESLAIHCPGPALAWEEIEQRVRKSLVELRSESEDLPRLVEVPVCYAEPCAPDLAAVGQACGLTPAEVVQLHSSVEYVVRMLGFTPGFPYLDGLPPVLTLPRRTVPRTAVPAGSVALAAGQAGIYPRSSPGGWHLIGRTPWRLFDAHRVPPALLAAGDRLRFRPISWAEFVAEGGSP